MILRLLSVIEKCDFISCIIPIYVQSKGSRSEVCKTTEPYLSDQNMRWRKDDVGNGCDVTSDLNETFFSGIIQSQCSLINETGDVRTTYVWNCC